MALAVLTIDINARLANIERDLGRAAHVAEKNGRKMEAAFAGAKAAFIGLGAALGAGTFMAGIKTVIDGADQLQKASQKYGVSVEQLSALKYAGALSDVSLEAIGTGLKKHSVNMLDTAAGTGEAKDAFKALGIGVSEAAGGLKSSDQVLGEIADKFAGMEDGAGKTALAVKLFGRAGADMIPLLNQGSRGLKEMKEEAEAFGVIVGGDLTKKSDEFNDNLTRLSTAADAFGIRLANSVLPSLNEFLQQMVSGIKIAGGFWDALTNFGTINPFKNHQENLRTYSAELAQVERRLQYAIPAAERAGLDANADKLRKRVAYLKEISRQQALATTSGLTGRLDSKDIGPAILAKAPGLPGDKKKKTIDDEITQMQALGKEYERMFESAEKYTAGLDAQIAKGRALTQSEQQLLEIERLLPTEWAASIKPLLERADALEKQKNGMERLNALIEATPTAQLEKQREDMILLAAAFEKGRLSAEGYFEAVAARLPEIQKPLSQMTEFTKQAAANMQDAMADGFFNVMQGKFDDLAGNFKQTIDRMVANLLASQLMNFLTGDFGRTGTMGGALGNLFSNLPSFDVGTDFVPRTGPALIHRGERIIPAAQNRAGGGKNIINNTINFAITGAVDRRTQGQIASEVGAAIDRSIRRDR